jgi:hypothetical protein
MKMGDGFRTFARRWLFAASFLIVLAAACSSDEPLSALAEGCLINSDCNAPLVCAFRRCHQACEDTRDCPPSLRCVASDRPFHVCQLESERACTYNSDCPRGQTCASDAQCRDQCQGDSDCLLNQICVAGSCAERDELRDGGLPMVLKEAGPSTGQPCSYNSQCSPPLVCRAMLCQLECLSSIDCTDGRQCIGSRCQVPVCPESDAGTGLVCAFSSDCPSPLVCRGGTCTCECRQSGDCPSGYDCIGNRCAPGSVDTVGPEGGLVASLDGRLTLEVPPGALAVRVNLTIDAAEAWPTGALGPVFAVRPSGTSFSTPATFVYRYQPADIAPVPAAEIRLAVASGSTWTPLNTTVNTVMGTASAQVTHLSTYGLVRAGDAGVGDAGRGGAGGAGGAGGLGGGSGAAGAGNPPRDASGGTIEAGTQRP